MNQELRVGQGYDIHRLDINVAEKRGLMIGGVCVSEQMHAVAHSDGDVLLHALCDALLGAAGLGDIGEHFPDTDDKWKDANSDKLLLACIKLLRQQRRKVINVDCTIQLENILLQEFKAPIRDNLARLLKLPPECINVKAKRGEGLDAVGRGEAIVARVVCLLDADDDRDG